jgi:hypothetical protein
VFTFSSDAVNAIGCEARFHVPIGAARPVIVYCTNNSLICMHSTLSFETDEDLVKIMSEDAVSEAAMRWDLDSWKVAEVIGPFELPGPALHFSMRWCR